MQSIVEKYADLLVNYCLEIKSGDRLLIQTTILAEPLVREVFRLATRKGAHVVTDLEWREQLRIYYKEASEEQLAWLSPLQVKAFEEFEAYLYIRAPYNLREGQDIDPTKRSLRSKSLTPIHAVYNRRTAVKSLKRCLCQFPTQAAAQGAGMSLEEYEYFVFNACKLYDQDPKASWMKVRREQQHLVDYMNKVADVRYVTNETDISFRVQGRIWMNSDGQTNMPSGEIYTAPIEDSVNGHIRFSYPSMYRSRPVQNIRLWVKNGLVVKWSADAGEELLDEVFEVAGARTFGEVAIGTNRNISKPTGNILFDEKIAGSIHMAVGQAYLQTGGTNASSIHWDMITDMRKGGQIWADGKKIYEDGEFLI